MVITDKSDAIGKCMENLQKQYEEVTRFEDYNRHAYILNWIAAARLECKRRDLVTKQSMVRSVLSFPEVDKRKKGVSIPIVDEQKKNPTWREKRFMKVQFVDTAMRSLQKKPCEGCQSTEHLYMRGGKGEVYVWECPEALEKEKKKDPLYMTGGAKRVKQEKVCKEWYAKFVKEKFPRSAAGSSVKKE